MARIVVADDDTALRRSVARYLERLGHDVIEAADGISVLAAVAASDVDLIVTDINMPDMDGIEVIAALREAGADPPVVAVSGGGLFHKSLLLGNAEVLGAFATVPKPFDLDELREVIRRALGEAPEVN